MNHFVTNQMIFEEIQKLLSAVMDSRKKELIEKLQTFSLNETAKILGKSPGTIRGLVEEGEIGCMVQNRSNAKGGVTYEFTAEDIKTYQAKRRNRIGLRVTSAASAEIDKMISDTLKECGG